MERVLSMKYYAESTMKRKYRQSGIDSRIIQDLKDLLTACGNFYYAIDIPAAFDVIREFSDITEAQFNALLLLMQRDASLDFIIVPESEFYSDCGDTLYLISKDYLMVENDECDDDAFDRFFSNPEEYDGPPLMLMDFDRLYPLLESQEGKPRYVPDDLPDYADDFYYEENESTEAMYEFLRERYQVPESVPEADKEAFREGFPGILLVEILDTIRDATISGNEQIKTVLEHLEKANIKIAKDELQTFLDLLMDLNNNTRLPYNNGYTPDEIYRPSERRLPEQVEFGSGMTEAIRNGDIDPEEYRSAILNMPDMPEALRKSMLEGIDKALGSHANPPASKVGPNDPCPCGSGKKYKKCCGRK